jgi:hypothetical protein
MCFKLGRKKGSENEVMDQFRHIIPEGFQNRGGPASGMGVSPVIARKMREPQSNRGAMPAERVEQAQVTHSLNVIASAFFALCAHCGQGARAPRG